MQYNYSKFTATDRLEQEIRSSSITVALDYITGTSTTTAIYFKLALSVEEVATLDGVVANHVATPLPNNAVGLVEVQKQPDPAPFAQPTFRTKRNATANLLVVAPGTTQVLDHILVEERFIHGGQLVVANAVVGDYVAAEIHDPNGVIPVEYRDPALGICEAWPTVAVYILKEWVNSGTHTINTYPLNAKVSAGLSLRVTYTAAAEGVDRKVGVTYYLTKKL